MATASLPERPNLAQLRKQARELQRAVSAGEPAVLKQAGLAVAAPDYPLRQAQLTLARQYGFASWARLRRHVEAIVARTWTLPAAAPDESVADRFLRLACLNYHDDDPRRLAAATVTHDQRGRVALLARNGVDVLSPLRSGLTPSEVAVINGHRELSEQLQQLGAPAVTLDPVDSFIAAALAGDAATVVSATPDVIRAARAKRPSLVVWAAGAERIEAVELLVAAGFDVNAFGRADLPVEQKWQTALHTTVERGNAGLLRRLIELGADPTLPDRRFNATALDWCDHFGQPGLAELISPPRHDR